MQHVFFENTGLYQMAEYHKNAIEPYRHMLKAAKIFGHMPGGLFADNKYVRCMDATIELCERLTRTYPKPQFGIDTTMINGKETGVIEQVVLSKPFCKLIHFKKKSKVALPKLLIVAPLSGHHATLLRNTVECTLPHFDVYITDWLNARDVPVSDGSFDLDDFIDYCIEFMECLAPGLNVLAVCQPTVPVLAGVSIMHSENNPLVPDSMILMGGPIDTRKNPTHVNIFAVQKTMGWFESHVVSCVPMGYPGYSRLVYPGFMQLAGFVMMNVQRHIDAHIGLFNSIVENDVLRMESQRKFYDEYFSVMDMPAEFYLQTIKTVFQDHDLPLGKMLSRDRKVIPADITKTALFGIEGENDDISGLGQTKAALELCSNLSARKKNYYMQKDVGHYGVFSGRRFREFIVPEIQKFVSKHSKIH